MTIGVDSALWHAFFANSADPCFAYSVDGPGRFSLAAVNAAWLETTGIPIEAVGKSLEELLPPAMVDVVREGLGRCVSERCVLSFEEELTFRGQARFWRTRLAPFEQGGEVRYILGFGHDYTELRRTGAALAESEAKFRRLVENADDVIYRVRLEPDVNIEYISPSIERLSGYPPEAFYGDGALFNELIVPEDRPKVAQRIAELQGEPGSTLTRWRRSDGSLRWVEARSVAVRDANGRAIAREGIARDMTEEKERELSRVALERRLQQTQKLESLGVLAGGIAHDFNNLLTGILGHASLLRLDAACPPSLREHADHIELAAERAADLCKQMLAYSGRGRFAIQRLDLDDLVRATTQLIKLSLAKSTTLKLELGTRGSVVEADATQLQQVVMNLVLNASEACEAQAGVVTLTTGEATLTQEELQDAFSAGERRPGRYVFLEVHDTGSGMSAETQAKIFDPFFSTKFTGRGLGLSAVLGIVRGHSGAIRVHSEPGVGTRFRVLFPAADGQPQPTVPASRAPAFESAGRVLVVDDEEVVVQVASRILSTLGFSVVTASNGREAIDVFRAASEPFAVVLMDLTMPVLDGFAAFAELRRLDPRLPVVLMSGYNEQDAVARFAGSGLAGFVQKPFTAPLLSEKLRLALRLA